MSGEPRPHLQELRTGLGELFAARRRLQGREKGPDSELTLTQCIALVRIRREGETTAGDLAQAAGLNPASVTAMLDQLEKRGIVKRVRSKTDRRVVLVSLTEQGAESLDAVRTRWDDVWSTEFAGVPDEDLIVALDVIRRMAALIDDHPPR